MALCLLLSAACRTAAPTLSGRAPDPLAPPVPGPALDDAQRRAVRTALAAAEQGDAPGVERSLAKLPAGHPVTRLTRLEVAYLQGRDVATEAGALASELAVYPAAWELAAATAAKVGRLNDALAAARQWQAVAPSDSARRTVARLEADEVSAATAEVEGFLAGGRSADALARARQAQALVPGNVGLRELVVRAALAAGEAREAAALVPSLPDDPAAVALKAQVAEALGQWELAAHLYETLPSGTAGRCEGITRSRERWRLANAPPYLRRAIEARALRRRDLAAILVWEHPELTKKPQAPVTVFEDVVQLPEQSDILTVARGGVMRGDALTRRFSPDRLVSVAEMRSTLERLAQVLGADAPRWCGAEVSGACLEMPETLDGTAAAVLVRRIARDGGDECH